jgi:hypothetical protein
LPKTSRVMTGHTAKHSPSAMPIMTLPTIRPSGPASARMKEATTARKEETTSTHSRESPREAMMSVSQPPPTRESALQMPKTTVTCWISSAADASAAGSVRPLPVVSYTPRSESTMRPVQLTSTKAEPRMTKTGQYMSQKKTE